jgi:GxxExxY protein
MRLDAGYRLDLIVEGAVVVEVKSVPTVLAVHQAQVVTYLRLTGCPAGLLINFNVPRLMDGVKRVLHPRSANIGDPVDALPRSPDESEHST